MQFKIQKITSSLNQIYKGEPWYGEGFLEKLQQVDWTTVNWVPSQKTPSIAKLVKHIVNWRIFVIEKLKENEEFNIQMNAENDWTEIKISSEQEWDSLLKEMELVQEETLNILKLKEDEFLDKKVGGRD